MLLDSKSVISGFMVLGIMLAVSCARGQGITLRDDFETGTTWKFPCASSMIATVGAPALRP